MSFKQSIALACTFLAVTACGSIKKDNSNKDDENQSPKASSAVFDFSIWASTSVTLTDSLSENRVFGYTGVSLSNTTVGPALTLAAANGCAVMSESSLNLKNVGVKGGSVCASGSMSLNGVDPNLPVQKQVDIDVAALSKDLKSFEESITKASETDNVVVIKRNQTLTLETRTAAPRYVAHLTAADLQGVFKIERSGLAGPILIVFKGIAANFNKVTVTEGFDPRQTLWYFDDTSRVIASQSLIRGSLFAPYGGMEFSDTRVDGSVHAYSVYGDVKVNWHPMQLTFDK